MLSMELIRRLIGFGKRFRALFAGGSFPPHWKRNPDGTRVEKDGNPVRDPSLDDGSWYIGDSTPASQALDYSSFSIIAIVMGRYRQKCVSW